MCVKTLNDIRYETDTIFYKIDQEAKPIYLWGQNNISKKMVK